MTDLIDDESLSGVRFWCGYRHPKYAQRKADFEQLIASIFAPQTIQQMTPMGLKSYSFVVTPENECATDVVLPDEIALVVYANHQAYQNAIRHSVAGRAYAALHGLAFNFDTHSSIPRSGSQVPSPWNGTLPIGKSIALAYKPRCWICSGIRIFLARRATHVNQAQFHQGIEKAIQQEFMGADPEPPAVSLLQVHENWLVYWEQFSEAKTSNMVNSLRALTAPAIVDQTARVLMVPPVFSFNDSGLQINTGKLLTLQLSDRAGNQ